MFEFLKRLFGGAAKAAADAAVEEVLEGAGEEVGGAVELDAVREAEGYLHALKETIPDEATRARFLRAYAGRIALAAGTSFIG